MPTTYAKKVAAVAQDQFDRFHLQHEDDTPLAGQIKKYWQALSLSFPGVSTPWSAVFTSWCMLTAGAEDDEFKFSPRHSEFVHWAIKNAAQQTGLFRAFEITAHAPQVGDIIQNNRNGHRFDFQFAKTHKQYASHSAVVVETGQDAKGNFALTIGGNEGDSVGMKLVRLTSTGLIKQRTVNPYICVIQNLK